MYRIVGPRQLLVTIAIISLNACSGSGGDPAGVVGGSGETSISVSLMDAPVDDVREVNVEIEALWIKPTEGEAFELPLVMSPFTIDLLEHGDGNAALLVDNAAIDPGSYEWLRMDVNAEIDNVLDSYVVVIDTEAWEEIRVPSGRVRLVDGFDIAANQAAELFFDWDMRKGLVHPPGLGGPYILKPAFRVIGVSLYGSLSGSIPVDTVMMEENDCNADSVDDENYDVGNSVYIFDGHGITVDDIDDMDAEPLATVAATLNEAATDYEYSTVLPFGDYTVAFTCQAANDESETSETNNDDPETDSVAFFEPAEEVTIGAPDDVDVVVNF